MNGAQLLQRVIKGPWLRPDRGREPLYWLPSLLFFVWKYVYVKPAAWELLALAATLLFFIPLYLSTFWLSRQGKLLAILMTCWLGALWAPVNFGASSLFIFACGMCSGLGAPRAYAMLAVVLTVATASVLGQQELALPFLVPTWVVGIPVCVASVAEHAVRASHERLLRKQEEVEHMARIAERERISRDLHDLLGHTLSLITLKAELAGKLIGRDTTACRSEIGDIEKTARQALAEVRAAVTGYRQTGFTHELAVASATLAAARIRFNPAVEPVSLPPAVENVMSLALREAVTNIVRHAQATRCELSFGCEGGVVVLHIRDDGQALANRAAVEDGNGLRGMRERVTGLGGKLAVHIERGLALEVRVPLGAAA